MKTNELKSLYKEQSGLEKNKKKKVKLSHGKTTPLEQNWTKKIKQKLI